MTEPVILALIAAVAAVLGAIVGGIVTFVLARRMQPSAIRASDAAAAESIATAAATVQATGEKYIDGQAKLFDRWEKSEASKLEILEQFGSLKALVISLQAENVQWKVDFGIVSQRADAAEARAIGCEQVVLDYKARYEALELKNDALELKSSDYLRRLELAEAEIASLKAAAVIVADTSAAHAQADLAKAATALIVAGGMPDLPPDAAALPTTPPVLSDKE